MVTKMAKKAMVFIVLDFKVTTSIKFYETKVGYEAIIVVTRK